MNNRYYDAWEFERALSLAESNPKEAKLRYEQYMEKYTKDYSAYSYYTYVLITLGKFEKAEKILNYVEEKYIKPNRINKHKMSSKIKFNFLFNKLRLLMYQKRYDEFEKLYLKYKDEIYGIDLDSIYLYCKVKLGQLKDIKRSDYNYRYRQIIEYKESDFLFHVQKHLYNHNENVEIQSDNIFSPDFPIESVVKEIKKYIPSEKRLYFGFIDDAYIFKYNYCGKDKNKIVDYFKVYCFHDTGNIITMCPADDCQDLPCVDLNYLAYDNIPKVKKISQIDKFNNRYKLK